MTHADDVNALEEARHVSKNMDAMVVHLVPTQTRTTLGHAAMTHADDVNAVEEARHVSKNMDAMVVHLVPTQTRLGQCNDACRGCQRGGGGKAMAIQKYGCKSSQTRTTLGHAAMTHADDVNAVGEARHVSKNMDAMVVHLVPTQTRAVHLVPNCDAMVVHLLPTIDVPQSKPGNTQTKCSSCLIGGGKDSCAHLCPREKRCQDCVVGKGGQGCLVPETCGKNGAGGDNPSQLGMECGACLKSGKGKKCGPSCPNEPPCQECISSGRGSGCLKDTACGTDGKGRFLAGKCNNDKPCGRCISHDAGHHVGVNAGVQQDGYCYNTQYYKDPCMRGNPKKARGPGSKWGKCFALIQIRS